MFSKEETLKTNLKLGKTQGKCFQRKQKYKNKEKVFKANESKLDQILGLERSAILNGGTGL